MPNAVDGSEKHLPVVRAMARERRPAQCGPEWDELRRHVRALVANLIHAHPDASRIVDARPGLSPARLAALDESTAALSVDCCVYLIEGTAPWTPLADGGEWGRPRAVAITLLYTEVPPEALH